MKNYFENMPLAIVMVIISAATSFAVTKVRVDNLEKNTEKAEKVIDELKDFRAEQKIKMDVTADDIKELKQDMKESMSQILREIKSLK